MRSLRRRGRARARAAAHRGRRPTSSRATSPASCSRPGPGDPARLDGPVALARAVIADGRPLLGICLGHQIVGRAAGAETRRLRFGHHGANHPVRDLDTGFVQVTAQNHEVQVVGETLPRDERLPRQPGQPQRRLGRGPAPPRAPDRDRPVPPRGRARARSTRSRSSTASSRRGGRDDARPVKPARRVLIIGSGPVVIGQAAEFDYAGTQACRALRAEGVRTILVNSNPATIMTDPDVADAVYLEPLTVAGDRGGHRARAARGPARRARRADRAQPGDGPRAGGRARALRTSSCSGRRSRRSGWPRTARRSATCSTGSASRTRRRRSSRARPRRRASGRADEALRSIGLPAIIRPAFTLGGTGGGIVETEAAYRERDPGRPPRQPDRPGHGRALPRRLAGDRVRGHARRRRHVHRRVLDGERRPARRPHRRLDRRRAGPDPAGRGPPAAAQRGAGDHPRARRRGRLQRPVRALAGLDRVRGDRGQPARLALVGARVEGDRLPDRPRRGADRDRAAARGDPERRSRARPSRRSSRRSTTWWSSCRASRSTSSPARIAASAAR